MVNKKLFLFMVFIFLGFCLIFAQEEDDVNYFIDFSERDPRFIQRLIWEESEFVLRYVVIIEKREANGSFSHIDRISTEETFVEVSLAVGNYRYQVELYDLFDIYASTSAWREFEIIRALQPTLTGFSPSIFYLDEDEVWEITVRGRNLLPESDIYLIEGNRIIRPIRHTVDGNQSLLVFNGISLATGRYEVYVRNPGGLSTSLGTFTITNKKPFDINLSLGFAPVTPFYGYLFKDFGELDAPFPGEVYLMGAVFKANFIPFKRVWGSLGVEASAAISYFTHKHDTYSAYAFLLDTHLSFLYQYYFIRKYFAVNISVGAGFSTLLNFWYEYPQGPPYDEIPLHTRPSAIAGLSFSMFAFRPFYINFGADFVHIFSAENDPWPGYLRPYIKAGIQF